MGRCLGHIRQTLLLIGLIPKYDPAIHQLEVSRRDVFEHKPRVKGLTEATAVRCLVCHGWCSDTADGPYGPFED